MVDEESNVMNSDECTKEVQRLFDSINVEEFDPRLLRESRQTEIDFMDQLDVLPHASGAVGIEHSSPSNDMDGRRRCQTT